MSFAFQRINLYAIIGLTIALMALNVPVSSAAESTSSSMGEVFMPDLATPANALQCVAPTDVMRRDHMKFLYAQRDKTVLDGIRTEKFSLTGCVNCHAQAGIDGKTLRAEDPSYFCTACHSYTGVTIDCFECHSDQPAKITSALDPGSGNLISEYYNLPVSDPRRGRLHQTLLQQVEMRVER